MKNINISSLFSFVLALMNFVIYYPGIFSLDSLHIYSQAMGGKFYDIHSTFIPMLLSLFLRVSGNVEIFIFLACLSGFFGVRRLSLAILRYFSVRESLHEWIACFVLLVLASPLTPFPIYLVTLWLDTWLVVFLLWVIVLLFELVLEKQKSNQRGLFYAMVLAALVLMVRSNSVVLYPAMAVAMIGAVWHGSLSRKVILVLSVFPLVIYLLFVYLQYRILHIERFHPERIVFALDLASMLTYKPSICEGLNLQTCRIVEEGLNPGFQIGHGAIDYTLNQSLGYSDPVFVKLTVSPYLSGDLWRVVARYPREYVIVKCLNFWDYIRPRNRYYYQSFIYPNDLGLALNSQFEDVRSLVFHALHRVYTHPVLKYFSFVHLSWVLVNVLGIVYCFVMRKRSGTFRFMGLILLIPASYSFSYLVALTASDFRFMYPSLVIMQVVALTSLFALLSNKTAYGKPG